MGILSSECFQDGGWASNETFDASTMLILSQALPKAEQMARFSQKDNGHLCLRAPGSQGSISVSEIAQRRRCGPCQ